jgi:Tol biopolymer transport system component
VALVGVAVFTVFERTAQSQTASPAPAARSSLAAGTADSKIAFISYPHRCQQCNFSPDGRAEHAFRSGRDGNLEIYVMNADGSEQQRLTRNPARSVQFLAWSPAQKK